MNKPRFNKWLVLVFNIAFFVVWANLIPIRFEENDDVFMCLIANGKYSGVPDGHLVFINALLGSLIAFLYRAISSIEWYTVVLSGIQIIAITGIVLNIAKETAVNNILKVVFILFLYIIWVRLIVSFQFTTTAGLMGLCGCIYLLSPTRKQRLFGVFCLFIATLVRFEAATIVVLLFSPFLLSHSIRNKKHLSDIAFVLSLICVGYYADRLFYLRPEWKEYKEYNAIRGRINDNPNAEIIPIGIGLEDYKLFCSFIGDPEICTVDKLRQVHEQINAEVFNNAIRNITRIRLYRIPIFVVLLGLTINCLAIHRKRGKHLILLSIILSSILFVIAIACICITATLKNRVFLCCLLPMAFIIIRWYDNSTISSSRMRYICILSLCLLFSALSLKYTNQCIKDVRVNQQDRTEFNLFQSSIINDFDGIVFPLGCKLQSISPFHIKDISFRIISLGWLTCIPFNSGILQNHLDFVDSDIAIFGRADNPPNRIKKQIENNYGIKVSTEAIRGNEKYALYILKTDYSDDSI